MTPDKDIKFYDTSSLLIAGENAFKEENKFLISSITLQELENIKTSKIKDEDIKQQARKVLKLLAENESSYEIILHHASYEQKLDDFDISPDLKILSDAIFSNDLFTDRIIFVTNDLALKNIANLYFGDGMIAAVTDISNDYSGCKEVVLQDEELAQFYQDLKQHRFNLCVGEYLIIKDSSENIVDLLVWTNEGFRNVEVRTFNSEWFGKIKPYDVYQKIFFDSLMNNQITLAKGPPGSGKSMISLSYLFHALDNNKIDKIIIFCNPVATINSARLGFTPGTLDDKLLDSQIGNILSSKLGDRCEVERLINSNKLLLLPFSNLRGYDTTNMRAGIYIPEAQNLDITLMKLALQRVGEDCFIIIEGDDKSQVDLNAYQGENNGMRRLSQVFRGQDVYGEVSLKNIYRSRISKIAENM